MLFHLLETGRHRAWHFGSTFWSTSAHAALVTSIAAGALPDGATPERVEREVVYLLPALPSAPRVPTEGRLSFRGEQPGMPERAGAGPRASGRDRPADSGVEPVRAPVVPVVIDSVVQAGSPVFLAAELDRIVERDPTSAGPIYPTELERGQIEGSVIAEWIVDTAGMADTTSFRVATATHPGFVAAVRSSLPLMRFRPAELLGRRVRQLVRQEFNFRIRLPEPDSASARPG